MWFALFCAFGSAVCYGVASTVQAVAARAAGDDRRGGRTTVDPRLIVALLRQWRYVGSLGLDTLGLVAQIAALRVLPLFVVQAAQAASVAVTAVVAARWLRLRLSRLEWASVVAVCAGLALLGSSARGEGAGHADQAFRYALAGATVVLGVAGVLAGRLADRPRTVALGVAGGLLFGVLGIAVRVLPDLSLGTLARDPATYTAIVAGILGGWFYAAALQRGSVVAATALTLLGETVPPSVIGVLVLGDHARPGWPPVAAAGFVVAVLGALALARFGELGEPGRAPTTRESMVRSE